MRWGIDTLGAQRLHPTFVMYLYLRVQQRAGKLAEASASSEELLVSHPMPGIRRSRTTFRSSTAASAPASRSRPSGVPRTSPVVGHPARSVATGRRLARRGRERVRLARRPRRAGPQADALQQAGLGPRAGRLLPAQRRLRPIGRSDGPRRHRGVPRQVRLPQRRQTTSSPSCSRPTCPTCRSTGSSLRTGTLLVIEEPADV